MKIPAHLSLALLILAFCSSAQKPPGLSDFFDLAQLKDYEAYRSSSNNADPSSNDDSKRPIPGETIVLADLTGPGVVTHIWITIAANEYGWPRLLRLRAYYEGSSIPSVDAPLGDFFGVGHGLERTVNSLAIRNASSGRSRNSYWSMPFRKSCKITVTNEGRRRVSNLYYHVDWRKMKSLPTGTGYFHARYRQALPAQAGKPLELLRVKGRGHYVGTVFSVVQTEPGWFGEGDELLYVDDQRKPNIEGTGTEDYFNDAWSLRVAEGPYAGVPVADGTEGLGSRMTAYRWHLADPIPFTRSFRFDFEHAGWTFNKNGSVRSAFEERADLFSTVAFWYQEGIAEDQPELPYGEARLPHGNARQIEAENLAGVTAERGRTEVQKEVFWSRDLLFLRAEGPGAKVNLPFEVAEAGDYELLAQLAHSPDYGIYEAWLDGKRLAPSTTLELEPGANLGDGGRIDAYHTEIYVAEDHVLGWKNLSPGTHVLTFVCTSRNGASQGYNLGIDTLILARVAKPKEMGGPRAAELRRLGERGDSAPVEALRGGLSERDSYAREAALWGFTQAPKNTAASVVLVAKALGDEDPVVRGLAAAALRNCGACAQPVIDTLIVHLKDSDPNVRLMTAEAIAGLGAAALPALSALTEAGQSADEQVHVQRSLANALGAIGPKAASALPVLEKMAALPRVRWAAQTAIARIKDGAR